jgi:hypothetical protein
MLGRVSDFSGVTECVAKYYRLALNPGAEQTWNWEEINKYINKVSSFRGALSALRLMVIIRQKTSLNQMLRYKSDSEWC